MEVTLTKNLFESDKLTLDKKLNFIFGQNGTGKSTLTNLINEQFKKTHDIRIFNGFDNIVGENKKLNAVILGEENNDINNQILQKENEKNNLKTILSQEQEKLKQFKEKLEELTTNFENKKKSVDKQLSQIASDIKTNDLNIVHPNYKINHLKQDIESKNVKELDEETIEKYKKIINSEAKKASEINIEKIYLQDLLNKTNIILQKEVKEKKAIARLENKDKIEFAMKGKDIHKKGDVCAFCGNKISDDVFEELIVYFSADEVSELENDVKNIKKECKDLENKVENISINQYQFYDKYRGKY